MKKFLSFLLVLLMVLSLTACGGGDNGGNNGGDSQNENVYTLGDFQIEYKGAEIAPDDDGFTSVIIKLGFTNNSKSAARYGYSMYQKAEQAGEFMLAAALNSVSDEGYMKEIEPGETVDVITGFILNAVDYQGNLNYTDEIKMSIEDADSGKSCTITIDTASLAAGDGGGSGGADDSGAGDSTGMAWLDYWVGDWFGWWYMTDGTGAYAEYSDTVWDACARIEAYETMQGLMELWDSDGSSDNLIAAIDLGFANPDDTDYGVMSCEGGQFLSMMLESGDWFVDPSQLAYDNIFDFSGEYVDEYGTFSYRVLLRPWGIMWDDLDEGYYPDCYEDWYLPLVRSGAAMPDTIG